MLHKFKYGSVEYREPNVPESLRLLAALGVDPENMEAALDFNKMASSIESVGKFIDKVEVDYEGKSISSWEELLKYRALTAEIMEISSLIVNPPEEKPDLKKS